MGPCASVLWFAASPFCRAKSSISFKIYWIDFEFYDGMSWLLWSTNFTFICRYVLIFCSSCILLSIISVSLPCSLPWQHNFTQFCISSIRANLFRMRIYAITEFARVVKLLSAIAATCNEIFRKSNYCSRFSALSRICNLVSIWNLLWVSICWSVALCCGELSLYSCDAVC